MPKPTVRPRRLEVDEAEDDYGKVNRVLKVLERLGRTPMTVAELAKALSVSERTMARFMKAMERAGWHVYIRKANPSAKPQWALDVEDLIARFERFRIRRESSNGSAAPGK